MNSLNMYFLLAIIDHDMDIFHAHHVGSLEVLQSLEVLKSNSLVGHTHTWQCVSIFLSLLRRKPQVVMVSTQSQQELPIFSASVPCAMVVDKMLCPTLYLTKWSTHDWFPMTWCGMKYSEQKKQATYNEMPIHVTKMEPEWSHKCLDHALVITWGSIYMINMCLYMQPIYTVIYPLAFYEQYHSIIHFEGSVMLNYSPLSKPYKTRIPLSILTSTSKGVC